MTRDCRHSTGNEQRLWTVQWMTRDCGQYRERAETVDSTGDDQRLQTVQGMTRDCRQYRR
ncbi:unnamed protein product [Staurois parvus]|uniref:Uncharacterized protein n=1 Tax=Staurois parvus TaxID=386267 RepID=A0ABN9BP32_9NEOB|nr:unnamed protein product [Staurois parvus]